MTIRANKSELHPTTYMQIQKNDRYIRKHNEENHPYS